MVFCVHYIFEYNLYRGKTLPFFGWTFTGVDLFFVLSGFLITGILFDTRQVPTFFGDFYKRRILRTFPLFYGIWLAIFLAWPLIHPALNRYNLSFLFYQGNIWSSWTNTGLLGASVINIRVLGHASEICIGHLWSLCIEEHFYLIWPLIVWAFPVRRTLLWISAGSAAAILLLRIGLYLHDPVFAVQTSPAFLYASSYTRFDQMLMGAWLALWLRGARATRPGLRKLAYALVVLPPAILALSRWTLGRQWLVNIENPQLETYGITLIGLAGVGVLLLSMDEETWVYRLLMIPQLTRLGRISYGFYCLHMLPWFFLVDHLPFFERHHAVYAVPVLAFVYSYVSAALSFRFLEKPFLRLKARVSRGHGLPHAETMPAGSASPNVA